MNVAPELVEVAVSNGASMPWQRVARAYWIDLRTEVTRTMRMPAFLVPTLLMPIALYLLIGIFYTQNMKFPGDQARTEQIVLAEMFVNFAVYALIGPGMLAFGAALAAEREKGMLALKRVMPVPGLAYVVPRMCMAVIYAAVVLAIQVVLAKTVGHMQTPTGDLVRFFFVMLPGVLPFCAIGLYIGAHLSSVAASAYVNLLYVGMTVLGGLFFQLPGVAGYARFLSPAHYAAEIGRWLLGLERPASVALESAIVLACLTVVLSTLAARGLRRTR
jgi:ABC-2 type transport system permease protein